MEAQRQRHGVGKQIVADAGGEPLANGLNVEGLDALQTQTQHHRTKQQQHQQAQGLRHRHAIKPAQGGLSPQHGDCLAHQQRLHRSSECHRDQQQQGEAEAAAITAEVGQQAG